MIQTFYFKWHGHGQDIFNYLYKRYVSFLDYVVIILWSEGPHVVIPVFAQLIFICCLLTWSYCYSQKFLVVIFCVLRWSFDICFKLNFLRCFVTLQRIYVIPNMEDLIIPLMCDDITCDSFCWKKSTDQDLK